MTPEADVCCSLLCFAEKDAQHAVVGDFLLISAEYRVSKVSFRVAVVHSSPFCLL